MIRNNQINANCPVPVFLCLSANVTLNLEGTLFAEKGLSGNRHNICAGIDKYKKLEFEKYIMMGGILQIMRILKIIDIQRLFMKTDFQ